MFVDYLFKLFSQEGVLLAMLTARDPAAAIAAYQADNVQARPVARAERSAWPNGESVFRTFS